MKFTLNLFLLSAFLVAATGCGPQDANPPKPPIDIPQGPKSCTDPLKQCTGGAIPTVDTATCKQTCPGE